MKRIHLSAAITAVILSLASTAQAQSPGSVVAWGAGAYEIEYGQTAVPVTAQSGVTAIAAGYAHTVALKIDGSVVAWGWNLYGQTNIPVTAQSGVTAIAAGAHHTVALKNDGTVLAWGDNYYGQTTVPLAAQSGVMAIAAGDDHTVALFGGPVSLQAWRTGNNLVVSWPVSGTGFTLQSTLNLNPPATWADVTNEPALLGAQWTVTNTFSGSARFYRLRKL